MIKDTPFLLFSDSRGKIFSHPKLRMLAKSAEILTVPPSAELIPLPKGSSIFYMPGHILYGYDKQTETFKELEFFEGKKIFPVTAFLIPAYTRLLLPAAKKIDKKVLPLWPYCAVGWLKGKFWVSAVRIDNLTRQRPHYYEDNRLLKYKINSKIKQFPKNRLFRHLSRCALEYNCRAAWNLFLERWEAPLPVSKSCNSRCLGCLSLQDSDFAVASHQRITFTPKAEEIAEVALSHIKNVKDAVVSFGQGCEGEPLMEFKTIKDAIYIIRKTTKKGTINLNTNASIPSSIKELAKAGLDSIRVSLNSANKDLYSVYYRPRGYKFDDVLKSIQTGKDNGLIVTLNLLVFPGITDTLNELDALTKIIANFKIDAIQMRNLSIDPAVYLRCIPGAKKKPIGILRMIDELKRRFPNLKFGYFNRPRDYYHK